jgi:hypothetical protein
LKPLQILLILVGEALFKEAARLFVKSLFIQI